MKRLALTLALTAALMGTAATPAVADHTLPPRVPSTLPHWPGSPEGLVMVSDRSGGRYPVAKAVAVWNRSAAVKVVNVGPVCPSHTPHRCVTIYTDSKAPKNTGYARVHVFGDHILAADIYLARTVDTSVADELLAHEIGHALGLDHRSGTKSVMESLVRDEWLPDAHDEAQLVLNRSH